MPRGTASPAKAARRSRTSTNLLLAAAAAVIIAMDDDDESSGGAAPPPPPPPRSMTIKTIKSAARGIQDVDAAKAGPCHAEQALDPAPAPAPAAPPVAPARGPAGVAGAKPPGAEHQSGAGAGAADKAASGACTASMDKAGQAADDAQLSRAAINGVVPPQQGTDAPVSPPVLSQTGVADPPKSQQKRRQRQKERLKDKVALDGTQAPAAEKPDQKAGIKSGPAAAQRLLPGTAPPFLQGTAAAGYDAYVAAALQQNAFLAERITRDAAARAMAAEQRAAVAEAQLEEVKERAVDVMENIQKAASEKVRNLEAQLEAERAKAAALERKIREMSVRGPLMLPSPGGAVPLGGPPKLVLPASVTPNSRPMSGTPRGLAPSPTGRGPQGGPLSLNLQGGPRMPPAWRPHSPSLGPALTTSASRGATPGTPTLSSGLLDVTKLGFQGAGGGGAQAMGPGAAATPVKVEGETLAREGAGGEKVEIVASPRADAKPAPAAADEDDESEATQDEKDDEKDDETESEMGERTEDDAKAAEEDDEEATEVEGGMGGAEDGDEGESAPPSGRLPRGRRGVRGREQPEEDDEGDRMDVLLKGLEQIKGLEEASKGEPRSTGRRSVGPRGTGAQPIKGHSGPARGAGRAARGRMPVGGQYGRGGGRSGPSKDAGESGGNRKAAGAGYGARGRTPRESPVKGADRRRGGGTGDGVGRGRKRRAPDEGLQDSEDTRGTPGKRLPRPSSKRLNQDEYDYY